MDGALARFHRGGSRVGRLRPCYIVRARQSRHQGTAEVHAVVGRSIHERTQSWILEIRCSSCGRKVGRNRDPLDTLAAQQWFTNPVAQSETCSFKVWESCLPRIAEFDRNNHATRSNTTCTCANVQMSCRFWILYFSICWPEPFEHAALTAHCSRFATVCIISAVQDASRP